MLWKDLISSDNERSQEAKLTNEFWQQCPPKLAVSLYLCIILQVFHVRVKLRLYSRQSWAQLTFIFISFLQETYKRPHRRLLKSSKVCDLFHPKPGRFSSRWFVLLSDTFFHIVVSMWFLSYHIAIKQRCFELMHGPRC